MARKVATTTIATKTALAKALDERDKIAAQLVDLDAQMQASELYQQIATLRERDSLLEVAVKDYVIGNYAAGSGWDDGDWKITKVVSMRRTWSADKLKDLVPRGLFKNLVTVTVVPAQIDKLVREGRLDLDAISDAFEEAPSAPYVRISRAKPGSGDDLDDLAAKLA